MKNILYDEAWGLDLPREVQLQRIRRVMEELLTDKQKQTLMAYYLEELRPAEIARRQGVCPSTVHRSLQRARKKIRQHLIY